MNVFQQTTNRALRKTAIVTCLLGVLYTSPAFGDDTADIQRLVHSGNYTEALKKTDKILALHPQDAQLRFIKGTILAEQNQTAAAISIFEKLTKDFPDLPEPYNNLAVLYASEQQYDKARAALAMALDTNPVYATAQKNLGDIYSTLAHQAYDKALDVNNANTASTAPKLALVNVIHGNITGGSLPALALPAVTKPAPATKSAEPKEEEVISNPEIVITKSSSPVPAPMPPVVQAPAAQTPASEPTAKPAKQAEPEKPVAEKPVPAPVVVSAPAVKPHEKTVADKPHIVTQETAAKVAPPPPKKEEKAKPAVIPDTKQIAAKEQQQVSAEVSGWAKAWSSKNVAVYLSYYAPTFKTPGGISRKAWENSRQARIVDKKEIRVAVSKVQVSVKDNVATAKFIQAYGSNQLTANTRKTLIFNKIGNHWLITEEIVGR